MWKTLTDRYPSESQNTAAHARAHMHAKKSYIRLSTCVPYTRARYSYMNASINSAPESQCQPGQPGSPPPLPPFIPWRKPDSHQPARLFSFWSNNPFLCKLQIHIKRKTKTKRKWAGNSTLKQVVA
ncbi:hypothetical protein J3F84DRAFT_151092 [Trichoderma pleuroticola]